MVFQVQSACRCNCYVEIHVINFVSSERQMFRDPMGVSCMSYAISGKLVHYRTNYRCGLPDKQRMIIDGSLVFRED